MFHHQKHELRRITAQELSHHAKQHSAWISLNGIVYDVTAYLHKHPGGSTLIENCGKECKDIFGSYHYFEGSKGALQNFLGKNAVMGYFLQ